MLHPLPGTLIDKTELLARWAYCELRSSRFGKKFNGVVAPAIIEQARAGIAFDRLDDSVRRDLAEAVSATREDSLVNAVRGHSRFRYELWSKGRLAQTHAAASHFPGAYDRNHPYLAYAGTRGVVPAGSAGDDARSVLGTIAAAPYAPPSEAIIIAMAFPGVLVDGYLRSLLFMRDSGPLAVLPAWVGQ